MDSLKEFLNKHRNVKLCHHGKWYKYKTLKKVLNHSCDKGVCNHCGYGNRIKYTIKADDGVCFYVNVFEACLTYSEQVDINDFSDEAGLYEYINKYKIDLTSKSDTDSY
jgi:hypothetical protein